MATKQIRVERFSVTSAKPFSEVVKMLEASVGHPNMNALMSHIASAKSFEDLEKVVNAQTGTTRTVTGAYDLGEIVRKAHGDSAPRSVLFDWQSADMKEMLERSPDAGSSARTE